MSRLIDADLLINAINKSTMHWGEHLWRQVVCDVINNQPTAYDISEFQRLKEKDTPKKITHQATLLKCCTCPSCLNVVDKFEKFGDTVVRVEFEYCHFCGQKLDWD